MESLHVPEIREVLPTTEVWRGGEAVFGAAGQPPGSRSLEIDLGGGRKTRLAQYPRRCLHRRIHRRSSWSHRPRALPQRHDRADAAPFAVGRQVDHCDHCRLPHRRRADRSRGAAHRVCSRAGGDRLRRRHRSARPRHDERRALQRGVHRSLSRISARPMSPAAGSRFRPTPRLRWPGQRPCSSRSWG